MPLQYRRIGSIIALAAIAIFFGKAIAAAIPQIEKQQWSISTGPFLLSIVGCTAIYFFNGIGWKRVLATLAITLDTKWAVSAWLASSITRYIPGIIWQYSSRIILAKKLGISPATTIKSLLLENLLMLASAAIWASPIIIFYASPATITYALCSLLLTLTTLFFWRKSARQALPFISRLKIFSLFQAFKDVSPRALSRVLAFYLISWGVFSLSFALFATSLIGDKQLSLFQLLMLATALPTSFVVGFVVAIAPSGIGIRELAMYGILNTFLPQPIATAIALGSRLWTMSAEVIALTLASPLIHRLNKLYLPKEEKD